MKLLLQATEIVLHGVSLDHSALTRLKEDLVSLRDLSPYGSYIHCELRQVDSAYVGLLSVVSQAVSSGSKSTDLDIKPLLERLFEDLRTKLTKWKRDRTFSSLV